MATMTSICFSLLHMSSRIHSFLHHWLTVRCTSFLVHNAIVLVSTYPVIYDASLNVQ